MKDEYVAYVGTYTHGSSIGIHLYDVNVEEGTLTERKVIPVNNSVFIIHCEFFHGVICYMKALQCLQWRMTET